jgi:hypothetical protein
LVGDLDAALATADAAGPMTGPPSSKMRNFMVGMLSDSDRTPPTQAQIAERTKLAQRFLAATVAGPRADALSGIAVATADIGNIPDALRAAAELDAEPRNVLAACRDVALAAISTAQQRAGDLEASLATALEMTAPLERLRRLRALAVIRPSN